LSEPSFSGKSLDDAQMLLSKFFKSPITSNQILEFAEKYYISYENFKLENNLADFNDVVFSVAKDEFPEEKIPTFELLIIDEAQDLSALQWDVVTKLSKKAKETILAGDDDQAIMVSFGAAPKLFIEFPTSLPDEVLSTSWRLPKNLKSYVDRNVNFKDDVGRKEKIWVENPDAKFDGQITNSILSGDDPSDPLKSRSITLRDLVRIIANRRHHEWLVMAPTRATCENVSNGLRALNVPHFLHRQDVISSDSKIFIQTIHTSKGMGIENVAVVLLTRGDDFLLKDKRLRYVALTRAKKEMFIVQKN
jgi:superfamily I DNA/RNA helicase